MVFKKGKKEYSSNYRPDSLISVLGKFMEITVRVTEKHLKDNTVIGQSQHGFAMGKSCLISLISFSNVVTHLVDQGRPVGMIF